MCGAVGGLIQPVDRPAHPLVCPLSPSYPQLLFCQRCPPHICGSALGHSTTVLFSLPSLLALCTFGSRLLHILLPHWFSTPICLRRVSPRLPSQHAFFWPTTCSHCPSPPDQPIIPLGRQLFAARAVFSPKAHQTYCNNTLCWRTISKYSLYSCIFSLTPPMARPRQPPARTT